MKKLILGAASAALALGLMAAAPAASAQDRYPLWVDAADSNKDGMVSRDEYLKAMGKMYDEKMAKMKKMSAADQAKMIKDDNMTIEAFRILYREMSGGGN
jgi:opacity protein-like surface antigen